MNDTSTPPAELVGLLWGWRRGDPMPALASPAKDWRITASQRADATPTAELCELMLRDFGLPLAASARRFGRGYHLYLGWLGERPVTCGWVARGAASMGNPGVAFQIPHDQTYLFAFETLTAWRGLGCYPALLQAILAEEPAEWSWIIHQSDNIASQRGIARAGFQRACAVYATVAGTLALRPDGAEDLAEAGAALLSLPLLADG
jgi:hypothetical protein